MQAWCVDRPTGTVVVIGDKATAEARASVMKAGGKEELMLNGPYHVEGEITHLIAALAALPEIPLTIEPWHTRTLAWNELVQGLVRRARELSK